jgi:hypothetical protein
LKNLQYHQNNGIPQGSVLMDFIAEMVLGYIDECLSRCLDEKSRYEKYNHTPVLAQLIFALLVLTILVFVLLFQLIHPVLYVDLAHKITQEENWEAIKKAFERFKQNKEIVCASIPVVSSNTLFPIFTNTIDLFIVLWIFV